MKLSPRVLLFVLLTALLCGCQSMGAKQSDAPTVALEPPPTAPQPAPPNEQPVPEDNAESSSDQAAAPAEQTDEPQEPTELLTPSGNQPIRGRLRSGEEVFSALRQGFSRPVCVDGPANEGWRRRYAGSPKVFANHLAEILPLLGYVTEEVRKRDLPTEFALIPIIESRYQPNAVGAGGPSGMWQMINSTARNHGVTIKDGYDGRFSVIDSTDAALSYLKDLDRIFKSDWRAMVMGYNAGEYRILGAFKRAGNRQVSGEQRLPRGLSHITYAYVDKLHALSCLIAEPTKHGLQLPNSKTFTPLREMEIGSNIDSLQELAQKQNISTNSLLALNPAYRNGRIPGNAPRRVLVPGASAEIRGIAMTKNNTDKPHEQSGNAREHKISTGDTLSRIASRYKISMKHLMSLNGLSSKSVLRIGQVLKLP